jgi:hypothetical protein
MAATVVEVVMEEVVVDPCGVLEGVVAEES